MNKHSEIRIAVAKYLVADLINKTSDNILSVFITSSVARGEANKNSDIDIHIVYNSYRLFQKFCNRR